MKAGGRCACACVLGRGARTTDVELTALVTGEDDTGHHLQVLGEVGLTTHTGDLGNRLGRHGDDRSLGLGTSLDLVGSDGHRLQLFAGFLQIILTADALSFRQGESFRNCVETYTGNQQRIFTIRDSVDVKVSVLVGRASVGGTFQPLGYYTCSPLGVANFEHSRAIETVMAKFEIDVARGSKELVCLFA